MRTITLCSNNDNDLQTQIQKYRGSLYSFERVTDYDYTMVRKYDGLGGTYIEYRCTLTIN